MCEFKVNPQPDSVHGCSNSKCPVTDRYSCVLLLEKCIGD